MEVMSKYPEVKNYIGGNFESNGQDRMDVISPLDGTTLSTMPLSTAGDLDKAVEAARSAYEGWSQTPIKDRVQIFYRYKTLMEQNIDELAELVHLENGKTLGEARAEVEKSIELTEFACSLPQLVEGEVLEQNWLKSPPVA